jgi:hypothetical protein
MGRVSVQGVLQHVARATRATATTGADAKLLAQLSQTAAAIGDGAANVAFGYRITDADVHGGSSGYLVSISLPCRVRRRR